MQRWGISERRLLPGSEVHFRDPTAWDVYRMHILLGRVPCFSFRQHLIFLAGFTNADSRRRSEAVAHGT